MLAGVGDFIKTRFARASREHGANGNGYQKAGAATEPVGARQGFLEEKTLRDASPFRLLTLVEQRKKNAQDPFGDAATTEIQAKMRRYLDHPDWRIRNVGVKLVGLTGRADRIPVLLAMLQDRTPDTWIRRLFGGDYRQVGFIRRNIVKVLGDLGFYGPEIRKALIGALEDPYYEVRSSAAAALRRLAGQVGSDPEVVQVLLRVLDDRSFDVITEAAQALGRIGSGEVVEPVLRLYRHASWRVREAALQTTHHLIERGIVTDTGGVEEALSHLLIPCPSFRPGFPLRAEIRELAQDLHRLKQR